MKHPKTTRYCASPDVLRLLAQDGLGWGHDLQCGAFTLPAYPTKKETS